MALPASTSDIRNYTHLIIVDAVRAEGAPGTVLRVPGEKLQKTQYLAVVRPPDRVETSSQPALESLNWHCGVIPKDI
jgi:Ni,Fe-hydrogenase maturation factor